MGGDGALRAPLLPLLVGGDLMVVLVKLSLVAWLHPFIECAKWFVCSWRKLNEETSFS